MKKKILLGICTFALVLGLTACGAKEEVTYGGHTAGDYEVMLQNYMTSLESIGEGDVASYIEYYESNGDEVTVGLLNNWATCAPMKGMFVEFTDFSLDKSGKTLTATLTADYTGRDLKLIFVYNINKLDEGPTAINVEPVYTLGETMQKAALNTVMGILIVFCMLVVMSLIIKCFELIPVIEKKLKNKGNKAEVVAETKVATVETEVTDDLALIAVISAAIAASTGASTDSFVVRSIKRRY